MRGQCLFATVVLVVAFLGGVAHAGSDPTTDGTLPAPSAPATGELPLVLSIRALSVGPAPFPASADMERVKAPTGAGTSRWPSASTEIGRGVYLSVMPVCIPGVDEPLGPPVSRRAAPARRR